MDFPKFFAILENRALFFPRITSLQDPFEGHPPRSVVEAFKKIPEGLSDDERKKRLYIVKNNLTLFRNSRHLICASCWHAKTTESAGMWSLYLKSGEGIAVKTTFKRLKDSLVANGPEVNGGLVQYVDYETYSPPAERVNDFETPGCMNLVSKDLALWWCRSPV